MRTILLLAILFLKLSEAKTQPGSASGSFVLSKNVILGVSFTATAFQTDGKLVGVRPVSGDIVVYRYTTDGIPDASFGSGGMVTTDFGSANDIPVSVAITYDGKIVVLANTTMQLTPSGPALPAVALARYSSNGSLDASFGVNGIVTNIYYNGHAFEIVDHLAIQNTGEIVISGRSFSPGGSRISIHRFNNNGAATSSVFVSVPPYTHVASTALAIQTNGKIVIGGSANRDFALSSIYSFIVARLNSDGTTDASFGVNGLVVSDTYGSSISVITLAIDNDEKIVISVTGNKLLRYNINGSLDATFGTSGGVATSFGVEKMLIQSDGKIIAGGSLGEDFALARYNNNGTVDASFGSGGMMTNDFGSSEGISDMITRGNRLYAYGSGIIACYTIQPEILPLKLISFTAKRDGKEIFLQWSATEEKNTNYTEIERSKDGKSFYAIGKVMTNNSINYAYIDIKPFGGANYYRLKIVDRDGKYQYSDIRIVNNANGFSVGLVSNLVSNNLKLNVISDKRTDVRLTMLSSDGKIIQRLSFTVGIGNQIKSFDISSLQRGYHFLRIETNSKESFLLKFLNL